MNLYLDTSALVKLYVQETGSADVAAHVEHATLVATSRVGYPEELDVDNVQKSSFPPS